MTAASSTHDSAVLVVEDLHFGYDPGRPILRGLSGKLEAGRICVLIGPNAAGKSTLMRLMLGQLTPAAGRVLLGGESVAAMPPGRRAAQMSYVPQRAGVGFAFSVEEVVTMGRYAQRPDPAAVERALESCSLLDVRGRVFSQLSFGQQQRVLLARAMAQAAGAGRVMLLDEPGSAMDIWHVHHMMGALAALARAGMAVLVVLHDLNLAARYADEVWLMDGGRLVAAGAWESVLVPAVLEPVYRVGLTPLMAVGGRRPVFAIEPEGAGGAIANLQAPR